MSTTSPGYVHQLDVLRHCPPTTFEHRLAQDLEGADDDTALDILLAILLSDPAGSHECHVAGGLLRELHPAPEGAVS